jgi:large subunit ribosomal protein L24
MKIRKGDQVKIITGKDKGKIGKVLRVFIPEKKITAENLNIVKKHNRPKREGEKGQRIEIPGKINVSNVMLVCPKCGKAARIGYRKTDAGKMRICKKCQSEI